jgi:hypothetical protein
VSAIARSGSGRLASGPEVSVIRHRMQQTAGMQQNGRLEGRP